MARSSSSSTTQRPKRLTLEAARPREKAPALMKITEGALQHSSQKTPAASDYKAQPLAAPNLPPGVKPSAEQLAADSSLALDFDAGANMSLWGWANALQCGLYFPGYAYLAELSQRSEYRSPCETMANEMTRKWIEFKTTGGGAHGDKLEELADAFAAFKVQEAFRRAAMIDNLFGRAQIYIELDGQEDQRANPLVIDKATIKPGSLKSLIVVEPMWTTPLVWNANNPLAKDFYKPGMWVVMGQQTHATRLLQFISREVPDLLKAAYNFGGISLVQLMMPYVDQWLRTRDSVSQLIQNFSIVALKTNLGSGVLAGGDGDDMRTRAQLLRQTRNNQSLWMLDKETEELDQLAVPLGTLDHLQAQSQEHMSAAAHIPLVKLFGITPSGLNASAEDEITVFYDHVRAMQEAVFTDNVTSLLRLMQLHLYGEIDETISFEFVPLTEPDGEALARQFKTKADAGVAYIQEGVLDPNEERDRLKADPNSGYDKLSGDAPELTPEQEAALVNGGASGGTGSESDDGGGSES